IVELWCKVLSRHELHPHGGPDIELTAEAWEERRQELARMTLSNASPILKAVAGDRAFYYKKYLVLKHKIMGSIWFGYGPRIWDPGADPGRMKEAHEKIAWAYEVAEVGKGSFDIVPNYLAMAQYRCGRYREALETLTRPNISRLRSGGSGNDPTELALLAM